MRRSIVVLELVIAAQVVGCGGGRADLPLIGPTGPTTQPAVPASRAWSIDIAIPKQNFAVGDTSRYTITVVDSVRNPLPNEAVAWSSGNTGVATAMNGLVTAVGPGATNITVAVVAKPSVSRTVPVNVATPPPVRPAGSLLTIGSDSVQQFGQWLGVSTLGVVDTSRAGADYRVAVLHTQGASGPPISRAEYPLVFNVAECPNGEVYSVESSSTFASSRLWRVNPVTAIVSLVGNVAMGPGVVVGLTCDPANSLIAAINFAGFGNVYRINRTNGVSSLIQDTGQLIGSYIGLASAPAGVLYATVEDRVSSPIPPTPQWVVSLNLSTGNIATRVKTPGVFIPGPALAFRGTRLLAATYIDLREINTQTGAVATIRSIRVP